MSKVSHEWLGVLAELCEKEIPCVLITVTHTKAHTPRDAGTKMVVTKTDQFGTIGGGNLEYDAVKQARDLIIEANDKSKLKDYALGPSLAQCCGGSVTILLEPFIKTNNRLFLFGAGHVGKEVVKVLDGLPVKIHWIDEREQEFPEKIPQNVLKIVTSTPVSELKNIDENSYLLIMSHSHDLDLEIVQAALAHPCFAYLGLIGSKTKRAQFEKRLKAQGIHDKDLSMLRCPIGLGDVPGKHPREIAIAVAAELLSLGLTHEIQAKIDEKKRAHIS